MWTMMLAAALLVQPADSVTVTGVVVDPAGKPVSDVEVVLAGRRPADESVPTLARTMTDAHGAFRLELARQRLQGIGPIRVIWAYRPGRMVATELADLTGKAAIPPVRLTLAEPLKRTPDDPRSRGPSAWGCSSCACPLPRQRQSRVLHSRRLAGAIDGRDRCRWGGHACLPPGDDRSARGARDRPRHRPARLPASRSSRQQSGHPETRAAGALGRFRLQRLGPAGGERPGRGLGGEPVLPPSNPDGNPRPGGSPVSFTSIRGRSAPGPMARSGRLLSS